MHFNWQWVVNSSTNIGKYGAEADPRIFFLHLPVLLSFIVSYPTGVTEAGAQQTKAAY
jgi:hypothetical protein